ncbi:type 1 glutamine amidotransferase domain-containing protein [Ornithinicoccus hortensis]|uniref:Protease I n=1 Tax=Ornithinicoccus hortensis TaxID=82346 RepID=A0A542YM86_9MICO|nr:type 1 glutamine amidotransferase domain-containing protein [Ornithinicoccus hortensis]TQL49151.1 protease I [Ornithinicoccus hortensis]
MTDLTGTKVAFLLTDGFEDSELTSPWDALVETGAEPVLISPEPGTLTGKKGYEAGVDLAVADADAADFAGLVLPGGVVNGDKLRMDADAVALTRAFFEQGKPVAAICHGGWILTDADVLRGRRLTSYPSLQTDLRNAGAEWVDEEVVVDNGLVSSRTPDDLPAFNAKLIEELSEGEHAGQTA